MTDQVPAEQIEQIVGIQRHRTMHYGRAVSAEERVYILHSQDCRDSGIDLRDCRFSLVLNWGIRAEDWNGYEDAVVALGIIRDRLVPLVKFEGCDA